MRITKDNIDILKHGDILYMPFSFKVPEKYTYVGIIDKYYTFVSSHNDNIKIFKDNFDFNWNVRNVKLLQLWHKVKLIRMSEINGT